MSTSCELTTFKSDEDARRFFYLYKNVVSKNVPDSERAEKIMAYLSGVAFDFYFDRFTLDNAPTDAAKDYGAMKKVVLEKFSIQRAESEIMRDALTIRYDGGDIPSFLSKADKVYIQAKVGENVKFELLRDALKFDQIFSSFCCSKDPRTMKA